MTLVAQDEQGLYVLAGERVGRPQQGQAQGLKAGSQVRAMFRAGALQGQGSVADAVRVRYAGQEQLWPAYLSRRQKRRGDPPRYVVGQQWRRHNGSTVTVGQVWPDGSMTTVGGGNYAADGSNKSYPGMPGRALSHLVSQPAKGVERPPATESAYAPTNDFTYRRGQAYVRGDGAKVIVSRVNSDGSMLSRGGGKYTRTGLNVQFPRRPNSLVKLIKDA